MLFSQYSEVTSEDLKLGHGAHCYSLFFPIGLLNKPLFFELIAGP